MRVAIDGPAGSGKSTVARVVAERCGLTYLDTGAMYRAVTWKCLVNGVPVDDVKRVAHLAQTISIEFGLDGRGQTVYVDGSDVTAAIRTPGVDRNVSAVSAIPAVREAMVARQRELGAAGDVVAEGRDIGTVVFPDAEVKVFLTADAAARAHRRTVQREGLDAAVDLDATTNAEEEKQVLDDILRRDQLDSTREVAPLRPAEGACHIDSSTLTVEEVVTRVVTLIDEARMTEPVIKGECVPFAKGGEQKTAEVTSQSIKSSSQKSLIAREKAEPLRAFAGNSFDDYRDRAMCEYPRPAKLFIGVVVGVLGFLTKLLWPWTFEDGEKLWSNRKGRVIIMNHVSMLEPVAAFVTLYVHGIRGRFIYKSEFDKNKFMSWLLSRAGCIPVERGTADLKAVRRAERALKRGECVVIYPEGTRIRSDEEPIEIHGGFALMAQLAKADVQPTAVVGARQITPQGAHFKRLFWRVFFKVGDPISFADIPAQGRKAKAREMERIAMEQVYALRDELRAKHPGKE
ncbi:(d)CMP kinase [Olegusella massiliensis]|uniref:(d)CMP kinase n=1 Tax=Olegusella massiliensis TaxID=1776381 RepID=UPI000838B382|nr:(d)CMP kinase [Olegusella massiliensis]